MFVVSIPISLVLLRRQPDRIRQVPREKVEEMPSGGADEAAAGQRLRSENTSILYTYLSQGRETKPMHTLMFELVG